MFSISEDGLFWRWHSPTFANGALVEDRRPTLVYSRILPNKEPCSTPTHVADHVGSILVRVKCRTKTRNNRDVRAAWLNAADVTRRDTSVDVTSFLGVFHRLASPILIRQERRLLLWTGRSGDLVTPSPYHRGGSRLFIHMMMHLN